nr:MAG TPA: hypothetical protein [Caudoviricetes sp.]
MNWNIPLSILSFLPFVNPHFSVPTVKGLTKINFFRHKQGSM